MTNAPGRPPLDRRHPSVSIHLRVPAETFREWAESEGFRDPLLARLRRLGVRRPRARFDQALAVPGWQGVAALEAATRASEALIDRRAIRSGTTPSGRSDEQRRESTRRTAAISNSAKLAPRQRRIPPPNGIQLYVPAGDSRKRSGRKRCGSG